jgi:hypothetical protein
MNEKGQVVGVVTSTAAVQAFFKQTGALPQNINWSVKSEYLKPLLAGQVVTSIVPKGGAVERAKRSVCLIRTRTKNS